MNANRKNPHQPPHPKLSSSQVEAMLKERGIQPTAQRIAIAQFVLCEADHPTAEEVKTWADRSLPKVSLATVYNTLGTLVEAGVLRELKLPHSDKVIFDSRVTPHHHFVDEETGQVIDLLPEHFEVHSKLGREFSVHEIEVVVKGRLNRSA